MRRVRTLEGCSGFALGAPPNTACSRRPPLRFLTACRARKGVSASGGFRQRGRVGAAHTGR
jgi:hypothetical protein